MTTRHFRLALVLLFLAAATVSTAQEDRSEPPEITPPWHDDPSLRHQDPKALEILTAGIDAMGGAEALLGRKTIYIKKKTINHQYPEPREGIITIWYKRPDKFRKEVIYPERQFVEVFDGQRAWFDTGSGPQTHGRIRIAAISDGLAELDLPANYLDADLTYFNISQEIPGKLAHVVKMRKNGYTKELMFDVDTQLLEITGEYENPWGAADKMTRFDRYRPIDGMLIPHRIEYWRGNTMTLETEIQEIKFNEPMDDALFAYPAVASSPAESEPQK